MPGSVTMPPKRQSHTTTPADTDVYLNTPATQKHCLLRRQTRTRSCSVTASGNTLMDLESAAFTVFYPASLTSGGIAEEDECKENLSPLRSFATCRRSTSSGSGSFAEPRSDSRRLAVRGCHSSRNTSCDETRANSCRAKQLSHLHHPRTQRSSKKRSKADVDTSEEVRTEVVDQDLSEADSQLLNLRIGTPECPRFKNYSSLEVPQTSTLPQHHLSTSRILASRENDAEDRTSKMMEAAMVHPRLVSSSALLEDCSPTVHHRVSSMLGLGTTTVSSATLPNSLLSSSQITAPPTRLVDREDCIVSANIICGESPPRVIVETSDCKEESLDIASSQDSSLYRISSETLPDSQMKTQPMLSTVSASSCTLSHFSTKKMPACEENPDWGRHLSGETPPTTESPRRPYTVRKNPRVASLSVMAARVAAVTFVEAAAGVAAAASAAEATTAAAGAVPQQQPQQHNFTVLVAEVSDDGYDALVADIWVGVVLTLMVLSCVCCVCSCLLYHKFQQWKRSVLAARNGPVREATEGPYSAGDLESLPSYTIVSGLPSYEEALEQLRLARERRESLKSLGSQGGGDSSPAPPAVPAAPVLVPASPPMQNALKLSVTEFFHMYKSYPPPV